MTVEHNARTKDELKLVTLWIDKELGIEHEYEEYQNFMRFLDKKGFLNAL